MSMSVKDWRNKHRKCLWCVHFSINEYFDYETQHKAHYFWCEAKQEHVNYNIYRPFCKVFKQKELED